MFYLLEILWFLVLTILHQEVPIDGIYVGIGEPEKKFSTNFTKLERKFCLRLRYNGDNNYMCVNERQICKIRFKSLNNMPPYYFCLASVL